MLKLLPVLILVAIPIFPQDQGGTGQVGVTFDFGAGWDQLFNSDFQSFLSANSLTPVDPARTWRTDWRWALELDPIYFAVGGSRMTNFLFGPYGDGARAKLVWDSTRLTIGLLVIRAAAVEWMAGGGVAIFGINLNPAAETASLWLRFGAQGGWLPFPAVWKLYGDPEVSGVPNPFSFYVRYAVWIGIEIR